MTITVTQEHINNGHPKSKCRCPIALAIADFLGFKSPKWVGVDATTASAMNDWHTRTDYNLPPEAQQFILDRDSRKPVAPFSFELTKRDEPIPITIH